jgi:hypothetical protein
MVKPDIFLFRWDTVCGQKKITQLPEEFENLDIICNVRSDTVLYELPPERTGKKGRPRIRGERISLNDFTLQEVKEMGMCAGAKTVMTNLFKKRPVTAIVTESKSGSRRLFLCTASSESLHFDTNCSGELFIMLKQIFLFCH